jgi:hypothetical protein
MEFVLGRLTPPGRPSPLQTRLSKIKNPFHLPRICSSVVHSAASTKRDSSASLRGPVLRRNGQSDVARGAHSLSCWDSNYHPPTYNQSQLVSLLWCYRCGVNRVVSFWWRCTLFNDSVLTKEAAQLPFSVAFIFSVSSFSSPSPLVTSKAAPISQRPQRSDNAALCSFGLRRSIGIGTLILPVLRYGLPKCDSVSREVRQPRLGKSWGFHNQDINLPSRWMYGWKALRNASRMAIFLSNKLFFHLVKDPTY